MKSVAGFQKQQLQSIETSCNWLSSAVSNISDELQSAGITRNPLEATGTAETNGLQASLKEFEISWNIVPTHRKMRMDGFFGFFGFFAIILGGLCLYKPSSPGLVSDVPIL